MMWKYNNINNDNSIIDTIYCSQIKMTIPIEYFWVVLLKDGSEYDLTNPDTWPKNPFGEDTYKGAVEAVKRMSVNGLYKD